MTSVSSSSIQTPYLLEPNLRLVSSSSIRSLDGTESLYAVLDGEIEVLIDPRMRISDSDMKEME